ncbi:hypothetical protein FRB99_002534 [Tulasnella sp. 403]|nr:hypothetical protein FRB99_002534 [Tulasnella sp. 403]
MRKRGTIKVDPSDGSPATTFQVKYLDRGSNGCAYIVIGGFMNPHTKQIEDAVAKTPRLDSKDQMPQMERWALEASERLFFQGISEHRLWMIMPHFLGVRMFDNRIFTSRYPNGYNDFKPDRKATPKIARSQKKKAFHDCREFVTAAQEKVIEAFRTFIFQYGWDPIDANWDNFLFTETGSLETSTVTIVDLGMAVHITSAQDPVKRIKRLDQYWKDRETELRNTFKDQGQFTVRDSYDYQGICQSDRRDGGERFIHPDDD